MSIKFNMKQFGEILNQLDEIAPTIPNDPDGCHDVVKAISEVRRLSKPILNESELAELSTEQDETLTYALGQASRLISMLDVLSLTGAEQDEAPLALSIAEVALANDISDVRKQMHLLTGDIEQLDRRELMDHLGSLTLLTSSISGVPYDAVAMLRVVLVSLVTLLVLMLSILTSVGAVRQTEFVVLANALGVITRSAFLMPCSIITFPMPAGKAAIGTGHTPLVVCTNYWQWMPSGTDRKINFNSWHSRTPNEPPPTITIYDRRGKPIETLDLGDTSHPISGRAWIKIHAKGAFGDGRRSYGVPTIKIS